MTYTSTVEPAALLTVTNTATPAPSATAVMKPVRDCFELKGAFPSPANNQTGIVYKACGNDEVEIDIYTVSGEKVMSLSRAANPGWNTIFWNLKNNNGKKTASGVYIFRVAEINAEEKKTLWGKVVVVR
jgi:hypothetical protein